MVVMPAFVRRAHIECARIESTAHPPPMLDTGDEIVSVGDKLTMAFASNPGDLMYPVAGFSPLPSEIFGTVSFDLGNAFNEFLWLAPNGMCSLPSPPSSSW